MSMTKRWVEDIQQKFAEYKFIKDGCPEEEAKKYDFLDAVEHFFNGDEEAAWDEAVAWYEAA